MFGITQRNVKGCLETKPGPEEYINALQSESPYSLTNVRDETPVELVQVISNYGSISGPEARENILMTQRVRELILSILQHIMVRRTVAG